MWQVVLVRSASGVDSAQRNTEPALDYRNGLAGGAGVEYLETLGWSSCYTNISRRTHFIFLPHRNGGLSRKYPYRKVLRRPHRHRQVSQRVASDLGVFGKGLTSEVKLAARGT
jgi:hypothetical protein